MLLSYSLIKGFSGLPVTRSQTSSQPLNNSGCFRHPSLGWIPSSCGASVAKSSRARGRSCTGHCSRTSTTGLVAECLGEASFDEPWNLNTQTSKRDELAIISHIKIQNDQSLGFLFLCELPKGWAPAIQTPLSLSLFLLSLSSRCPILRPQWSQIHWVFGAQGEVQYRERARKHVTDQAAADELLLSTAQQLATLEAQRVEYWKSFAESYRSCCGQQGVVLQDEAMIGNGSGWCFWLNSRFQDNRANSTPLGALVLPEGEAHKLGCWGKRSSWGLGWSCSSPV